MEALLDHGAQVNVDDTAGQTPLHRVLLGYQICKTHSVCVAWAHEFPLYRRSYIRRFKLLLQQLLERGADANAQNKNHETPLHLASLFRLHDMARTLLKHGADVTVKNSEGKSPLQLASGRKGKAMRRLLSEYSAK